MQPIKTARIENDSVFPVHLLKYDGLNSITGCSVCENCEPLAYAAKLNAPSGGLHPIPRRSSAISRFAQLLAIFRDGCGRGN